MNMAAYAKAGEVCPVTKQEKLLELQKYNFAAYDLLLFLDTHPEDKTGFAMFRDMVEKMKRLKAEYEEQYGPLEPYSAAKFDTFKWLESPWPWEKEGNA